MEEVRACAEMIRADGDGAGEIVGQDARAGEESSKRRKDWLDIDQTIREVIALAHSELQRNGIALETRLSDNVHYVPLVFADRIRLNKLF